MSDSIEIVRLLTEIKAGLSGASISKIAIASVAAGSACLGALITGLIQYFNLRFQIQSDKEKQVINLQAEIISKQRQQWMDSIRESAIEIISEFSFLCNIVDSANVTEEQINNAFMSIVKNSAFIELKLNTNKPIQERVVNAISDLKTVFMQGLNTQQAINIENYNSAIQEFKSSLTEVFSETWQRIKKLELSE